MTISHPARIIRSLYDKHVFRDTPRLVFEPFRRHLRLQLGLWGYVVSLLWEKWSGGGVRRDRGGNAWSRV